MRPSIPSNFLSTLSNLSRSLNARKPSSAARLDAQSQFKTFSPRTPSLRHVRLPYAPFLHKGKPMRHLTVALRSTGGRNNFGRVTSRHRGGGHKRRLRVITYGKVSGTVERLEYDPNRSAHIALVKRCVHCLLAGLHLHPMANTCTHTLCNPDSTEATEVRKKTGPTLLRLSPCPPAP